MKRYFGCGYSAESLHAVEKRQPHVGNDGISKGETGHQTLRDAKEEFNGVQEHPSF